MAGGDVSQSITKAQIHCPMNVIHENLHFLSESFPPPKISSTKDIIEFIDENDMETVDDVWKSDEWSVIIFGETYRA